MGKTKVKPVEDLNPQVDEVEKIEEQRDAGDEEVEQTEPEKSFEELGLDSRLIRALDKKGIEKPTPVQKIAIPIILVIYKVSSFFRNFVESYNVVVLLD